MGGTFRVDLSEVEWTLSFPCPACGNPLFPEDNSGQHNYLLETTIEESIIIEAIIQCNRCGSIIILKGLEWLRLTTTSSTVTLSVPFGQGPRYVGH